MNFNIILVVAILFSAATAVMAVIIGIKKYSFISISNRIKETKFNDCALNILFAIDIVTFGCLFFITEFGQIFNHFDSRNAESNPFWSFFITMCVVLLVMIGYGAIMALINDLACRARYSSLSRRSLKVAAERKSADERIEKILSL